MFYLRDKNSKKTAINAIVSFKGKRYKIRTGEVVDTKSWNLNNCRSFTGRDHPEGYTLNKKLDQIEAEIKEVFNEFNIKRILPTIQEVRTALEGNNSNEEIMFSDYIAQEIELLRTSKAVSTIKKYVTTLHKVTDYEKDRKVKLRFKDVDIHFYLDFRNWFYQSATHNTKNYFGSIVKNIKKFMNTALVNKVHDYDGHKHPDFKTEQEEADTIYLNDEELRVIYDYKITEEGVRELYPDIYAQNLRRKIESLEKSRARFLIGAFTLLRVSDFKRLSEVNVRDGFIRIKPKKRAKGRKNRDLVIPMHPLVKEILEKGTDLSDGLSEQKINVHIKELCKLAGIDGDEVIVRTEKGREVEKIFKKYELVTTHTARRSAATNMLLAGMEASDIMMLGGWNSEKAFWKYIRMEPELNAKRLKDHFYFMNGD